MSAEIITMLGGFATLLASGGTFAMFMFRLFVWLEGRVDALAGEVADLRGDFSELSREVSELHGEFRGRFGTQPAAERSFVPFGALSRLKFGRAYNPRNGWAVCCRGP